MSISPPTMAEPVLAVAQELEISPQFDDAEWNDEDNGSLPRHLWPNVDHLITEDDTPVDNFYSEKQQKFLTTTLYATPHPFGEGRAFIAVANVGLFNSPEVPALVPDVMVSLDVTLPVDIWEKGNRTYLIWRFHKTPEVVIEIVSNEVGGEDDEKLRRYEQMRIPYYVVYDPANQRGDRTLRVFEMQGVSYALRLDYWLSGVGLGLALWKGTFEDREDTWLRWCDSNGDVLLTGEERAEQERLRAERLAAQLRALGVEPDVEA